MSKKAQSLSIQTIVVAIIAITVLIIVILFATGSLGTLFARTDDVSTVTEGASTVAAKVKCEQGCIEAKTIGQPEQSTYCTLTFDIDADEDGTIDPATELGLSCSNAPINVLCEGISCT